MFIGLNSFNLFETPKILSFDDDLNYETLFKLEKAIHKAVSINPFAQWPDLYLAITEAGFKVIDLNESEIAAAGQTIFWHSRQWDEHLTGSANSFFVSFPDSAPAEIRRQVFFATTYANLFAITSVDHLPNNALLLVSGDHQILYSDDLVWADDDRTFKSPIGPVLLFKDQFFDPRQAEFAYAELIRSGYQANIPVKV